MFTHKYKGAFIHGYTYKAECCVTSKCGNFVGRTFKSYRAAQIAITKVQGND